MQHTEYLSALESVALRWYACPACAGRGCEACDYYGLQYREG